MRSIPRFAVLVALVFGGAEAKPPSRIVGGDVADRAEFPYQASFRKYGYHKCGGTIISNQHILTAAHCVRGPRACPIKDMSVMIGSNFIHPPQGVIKAVKNFTVHPDYSNVYPNWQNDIAIITLVDEIEFNMFTRVAQLPENDTVGDLNCVASGWGDLSYPDGEQPFNLRKADMTTVASEDCREDLGRIDINDSHICASAPMGTGVCSGDSGGPLTCNGEVVGIASFVVPCGHGIPDVYTRVFSNLDFIRTTMANT